jgi:ferredoxin-fold anticodon binding domain-containing protein
LNKFPAIFLGASFVLASAVYNVEELTNLYWRANKIRTSDGVVVLGKVDAERLLVKFRIIDAVDGDELLSASGYAGNVHSAAMTKLENSVAILNKEGGIKTDAGKSEALSIESASYKKDVKVIISSYVVYSADLLKSFELSIDNSEYTVAAGDKSIKSIISDLALYEENIIDKAKSAPTFVGRY